MEYEYTFEFDEAHPIPNLDVVDVHTILNSGGSRLYMIIAAPLGEDRRSLERLMCKLERYIAYFQCNECIEQCGEPTVTNTTIIVKLHPDSSPLAFELLERNKEWVRNNDATLEIETSEIVDSMH